MSDTFELVGQDVTVATATGGIVPLAVPDGVRASVFRNALSATYSAFLAYGRFPSVEEVHEFWDRISEATYAELFLTPEFAAALEHRGVTIGSNGGLSYEQSLTIDKLSNPLDKRSNEAKLKELGVSSVKLAAWRKNPLFQKVMAQRSETNLLEHVPDVLNRLIGKAESGNIAAIDRVLAMSGRFDPQNRETIVIKEFLVQFYRIIAQRIPDEELRNAIAQDMTLAAGNIAMIESTTKGIA